MGLDQPARLERLSNVHQVQRRDIGAGPRPPVHEALERQPAQRLAHPGQAGRIAPGEVLFIQPRARGEFAEDDVQQNLLVGTGLLQVRGPSVQSGR